MASNKQTWVGNLNGVAEPLVILGKFQAGGTQAIKQGEILELSGGNWIPLDANQAMAAVIAVANEEIKSGDRAGYYEIIVPRPGDVFEYSIETANDVTVGSALYWKTSQQVTETAGAGNVLGRAVGQQHYPKKQEHLADGGVADMGTTISLTSYVRFTFTQAASYWAALVV